jgi:hypothetical protein
MARFIHRHACTEGIGGKPRPTFTERNPTFTPGTLAMKNNTKISRLPALLIPAAGLGALLASPAEAVEAILAVDAYVSASQPATNFGNAETLPVGNGNRVLLRFDVASMLPAGTAAGQVSKAVLQVWVSDITKAGSVEVSELLGSWTEPGVTETTLPGVGPAFATKAVSLAGRWVPVVVTDQVKKWLSDPTTNKGLLIGPAATAPATAVALDSKENTATSHPARLEIELAGTLGGAYTLIVGKTNTSDNTGRTQMSVPDFTTIAAALKRIPNNLYSNGACSARYLVKVLPGVYSERVKMKPCVDIEGSGELTTRITAAGGTTWDAASATVSGADAAELRFLTVANTGGGNYAIGIFNTGASPRLTQVTVNASGSPWIYGVFNNSASPAMTHVAATASGGTGANYGVFNYLSSLPAMIHVTATASGGIDGTDNYGVYNADSSSPAMTNVTATALGGNTSVGVANSSSSPTMTNVTATASGGSSKNVAVMNYSSSPRMTEVTATASGSGSTNYGVANYTSSSPVIDRSTLSGTTASLYNVSGTFRVGASKLDGPVSGPAACVASYTASYAAVGTNCQ